MSCAWIANRGRDWRKTSVENERPRNGLEHSKVRIRDVSLLSGRIGNAQGGGCCWQVGSAAERHEEATVRKGEGQV